MAALPKRKTSKSRTRSRRAGHQAMVKMPQLKVSKLTGKLVPVGIVCEDEPNHKDIPIVTKAKK